MTDEEYIAKPITWVVDNIINERNFYQTGFPTLAEAARELGHNVIETKYVPFRDRTDLYQHELSNGRRLFSGDGACEIDAEDCTVFHGSHEFIRSARNTHHFRQTCPLAFCREENLRFSTFATYHGDKLLSDDYVIMSYAEMIRRYGKENRDIFVKPNEVTKAFAGRVINFADFDFEVNSLNQIEKPDPEMLCVIATPRKIIGEFRTIICDGEVITGSEYRWDDKLDIRIDVDERCLRLAEEVAKHPWQPDRVYVCDVALTEDWEAPSTYTVTDKPVPGVVAKLIELNSFSCAGLYACDTRKIVEAVSRAANKEFYGLD